MQPRREKVGHVNNWRSRVWADACEAARVKAAPYDGRHTYASLLIHEGRALPYVTAALGHVFDEARLAPPVGMVEAIETARAELEARGVYPICTRHPVRVLRATAGTA